MNGDSSNGSNGAGVAERVDEVAAYGWSTIGVHDLVPKLGYREYWYPAAKVSEVGRRRYGFFGRQRPLQVKMLGEDVALFPGKDGGVSAVWDRCPHRGALLSGGFCEYDGTISCPYHGYTFDGTGVCVAALTEGPDSALTGKLRVRSFPTAVVRGVVWVWMGQTAPVPIEEDVPPEFYDETCVIYPYAKLWPMNWTLTVENAGDSHNSVIHRFRMRRLLDFSAFQQLPAYWSGVRIVEETDNSIGHKPMVHAPHQATYPGLGNKKWPQHVWWRFRKTRPRGSKTFTGKPYSTTYRLPSVVYTDRMNELHIRYATPIDENNNIMWTFATRRATKPWQRPLMALYLRTWYKFFVIKGINEREDLPVQRYDRLDVTAPQKLGANDRMIIFWRRRMPLKSRDNLRIWKKGKQPTEELEVRGQQEEEAFTTVTAGD